MAQQNSLSAKVRLKTGKGSARAARREGRIPAILYSHFADALPLSINPDELEQIVVESPSRFNTVLTLELDDKQKRTALLKDWQTDPLSRKLLHADFIEIKLDEKIESEVELRLVGKCIGIENGGALNQVRRELIVRCLPSDLPSFIEVDITNLDINDSLHVGDVKPPEKVEVVYATNYTVAVIAPPEKEEAKPGAAAAVVAAPAKAAKASDDSAS